MAKNNLHGGDIYSAARSLGMRAEEILDYSANINPLGIPQVIRELLVSNIDSLVNYPDPQCTELRVDISNYLGIGTDNIIIGNGASEIILLLFDVLRLRRVLIPAPSFSEYSRAAESFGTGIKYFRLREEEGFKLDMSSLFSEMTDDVDALFLCNPNNPTSTLMEAKQLLELVSYASSKNIYVFIDETFMELTVDGNKNSLAGAIEKYKNLFIIRAFTKVFAIPGLRLGYGLGNREIIEKMWKRKLPWSVNSFACCIGKVLDDGKDYLLKTSKWLETELKWFYNELSSLESLKVFEPNTNFVLAKLTDGTAAQDLRNRMVAKGILIRDASNFVFLDRSFFRLAVKDRASNIRLLEELKEVLKSQK